MLPINQRLIKHNFRDVNDLDRIKYIVIHYFGDLASAEAVANYFYGTEAQASAHYCVDDTSIWQCVLDEDIAGHCGGNGIGEYKGICTNDNSIGIEVRPYKTNIITELEIDRDWYFHDATINNVIDLTQMLMNKYNVPVENVIRHFDVTGKWCPRPFMGNDINTYYRTTGNEKWRDFKKKLEKNQTIEQENFNRLMDNYLKKLASKEPSSWSLLSREWAEKNGILKGTLTGKEYKLFCTREQMIEFLYRENKLK